MTEKTIGQDLLCLLVVIALGCWLSGCTVHAGIDWIGKTEASRTLETSEFRAKSNKY